MNETVKTILWAAAFFGGVAAYTVWAGMLGGWPIFWR